jgi:phosphatidylserine/phosphatidylglycerophosphate/cardiolipin synthase-like enzyme
VSVFSPARGVRDPGFEVLLRRIDASPPYRGNAVTVFFDGPSAFDSMCAAIRGALPLLARAAARGVDVRLLLPGVSDVPLVRHAGHGIFRYLLERGVRIFEYETSVLHAKTVVADGWVSMVGSTNMDFRSFTLDLAGTREITRAEWDRRTALHKLGDVCARVLSPAL